MFVCQIQNGSQKVETRQALPVRQEGLLAQQTFLMSLKLQHLGSHPLCFPWSAPVSWLHSSFYFQLGLMELLLITLSTLSPVHSHSPGVTSSSCCSWSVQGRKDWDGPTIMWLQHLETCLLASHRLGNLTRRGFSTHAQTVFFSVYTPILAEREARQEKCVLCQNLLCFWVTLGERKVLG